jgi:hypothetical protein
MINYDTPIADWLEQSTSAEHAGGIFVLERPLDYRDRTDPVVIANCFLHFPARVSPIVFGPDDENTPIGLFPAGLDLDWKTVSAN